VGFVIRRGTRDNPRYYIRYIDVDGGAKTRNVLARINVEVERCLHEVETRLMEGRLGTEPKGPAPMVVDLMDEWIATITNRNAADDRSRFKRHLRPAFEGMTLVQATELGSIMKWVADQRPARKADESGKKVEGLSRQGEVGAVAVGRRRVPGDPAQLRDQEPRGGRVARRGARGGRALEPRGDEAVL
jgi:hypothetical protein